MQLLVCNQDKLRESLSNNRRSSYLMTPSAVLSKRFLRQVKAEDACVLFGWSYVLSPNSSFGVAMMAIDRRKNRKDVFSFKKIMADYQILEEKGALSEEAAKQWIKANLEIFNSSKLSLRFLRTSTIYHSQMRNSAPMLIKYLLDKGVPVCIISSGIKEVIEFTLQRNGIKDKDYANLQINALDLNFNKQGSFDGYNHNTILTETKKANIAHKFADIWKAKPENVFAVVNDTAMLRYFGAETTAIMFCAKDRKVRIPKNAHGFVKHDFNVVSDTLKYIIK